MKARAWSGALAILAAAAAALVAAAPAAAVSCERNLADPLSFNWDMNDDGSVEDGSSDAYDTLGNLEVEVLGVGTTYEAPDDNACAFEDADRELIYPAQTISGLQVSRKFYAPASGLAFGRWLSIVTNPTGAPITATVRFSGRLGSDADTDLHTTSSGDATMATGDTWATTTDTLASVDPNDPGLAHVWDAVPAAAKKATVTDPWTDTDDLMEIEYADLVVPAGGTIILMHFEAQRALGSAAQALEAAQTIGRGAIEAYAGLSTAERAKLVNWPADADGDGDGRLNLADNCPSTANANQVDADSDGKGDACDEDIDGDGRSNIVELGSGTDPNAADTDGDGVPDGMDKCPVTSGFAKDGCEDVIRPRARGLKVAKKVARAKLLKKGLSFRVRCNERCSVQAELVGTAVGARLARAGDLVVGTGKSSKKKNSHKVKVRVQRRLRRTVRKGTRLKLRVTVTDRSGNSRVVTRRLRVK